MGLILDATTKSLIVKLGGAVTTTQWDWTASWIAKTATAVTPGSADGQTSGASEVTMIAAPAASEQREAKTVTIHNRDTVAGTVIVEEAISATRRRMYERVVPPGRTVTIDCGGVSEFPAAASAGDMAGPVSSTDNAIARWDGTNGDTLQNSTVVVDDSGNVTGVVAITTTGLGTFASVAFSSWTLIAAKGDLPVGTANDTVGILTAAANYHILQTNSTEATGLQWSHRCHLWHSETADASAHHTSSSESAALYSSTAIPTAMINEQRKMLRVRTWGKASTTSAPTLTLRIKLNDTSVSQAIGTITGTSPGSGVTDRMVEAEAWFVVRTTGSSGTIQGFQRGQHSATGTYGRGVITLNLTNDITVEVTAQWSASSASNTVTLEGFTVEILN